MKGGQDAIYFITADSLATVMTVAERKTAFQIARRRDAAARVVRMESGKPVVEAIARSPG